MSDDTRIGSTGKQLIMGMTFEFVILIIKLANRLTNLDELSDKEMDIIQETVCSLQSLIGTTIEVDREDIRLGAMMATKHDNMEGLREYLSKTMAET
jgi:(p)ppGpp synthase/HD superfamily hydrolase